MRILKEESGQTLTLLCLCMGVFLGFTALATDVGLLFRAKRNMQIAADAAAVAAALDYVYNSSLTSAQGAGTTAANNNGVVAVTGGASVAVNCPPTTGPNATGGSSCNGYFEAIVSNPNPTIFMRAFHINSISVGARAVAGTPAAGNFCIWVMNPTASDVLHLQGSGVINAQKCGIYVNSTASDAVKVTGNATTITGTVFDVVGGYQGHNPSPTGITTSSAVTGPAIGTNIAGPAPASACASGNTVTASTVTSTLLAAASSSSGVVCFSSANVTLSNGLVLPGATNGIVYLFENGVTIPTGATVTFGSTGGQNAQGQYINTLGAVMDLYGVGSSGGTLNQNSNSLLNMYAPTAGAYNSIAILQPPSNTNQLQVQFGSNNESLDGIIYAPGAEVFLQDNGGGIEATGVVSNTMYLKSSTITVPGYGAANLATTPFRVVGLVE
jgi:hypothetical protein